MSPRGKTSDRATSHQTDSNDKRESAGQYCGHSHAPRHCGSVRRMARCVRNVRTKNTSQSCVEVVDLERLEGSYGYSRYQ